MNCFKNISIALCCMAVISCGNGGKKASQQTARPFPMVQAPAMMDPAQKLEYLLDHYWDNVLDTSKTVACDSTLICGVAPKDMEQAVSNYILLLNQVDLDRARINVAALAEGIVANGVAGDRGQVFKGLAPIVERYFYDANSPLRDEDMYTAYAAVMAGCALCSSSSREVYRYQAEVTSLNRRGSVATDFAFSDRDGRVRTLHSIKGEYTILFFSNPGCTACREIINALTGEEDLARLVDEGRIAVVNVYIDEDLAEWYEYMPIYPLQWYNGYDHNHIIRDEELYNVRAIPSLYLLDKDKMVVLKDATQERLFGTIRNIYAL